jgi:hypothetical protein
LFALSGCGCCIGVFVAEVTDEETLMRLFSSRKPRRSLIGSFVTDSGGSASRLQPVSLSCSSLSGCT